MYLIILGNNIHPSRGLVQSYGYCCMDTLHDFLPARRVINIPCHWSKYFDGNNRNKKDASSELIPIS